MTTIDLDHPLDPPTGSWQEEHLSRYLRTGGQDGHIWNGAPTLLLTTRDHHLGRARAATAEEKARLWEIMTGIWPDYDEYQTRTDRSIPLVIIERA